MEIRQEALSFSGMHIAAGIAVFASTMLWTVLLGMTGIASNDLFTFKLQFLLGKVLTINFLLFLITFPMPGAITTAFARRLNKVSLGAVATTASIPALIAAMAIFPNLQGLWPIAIFYIISLPFVVETATAKYQELKKWVTIRTTTASAGKTIGVTAVGLLALSALTILPDQEPYVGRFEDMIVDFASEFTAGKNQQSLSSGVSDLIIESQATIVDQMLENPLYTKLKEKTDPDVVAFTLLADSAKDFVRSPEYRQQVEEQASETGQTVLQDLDIIETAKSQMPWIETLERWLWLLHALALLGLFSLAANIVSKPMSAAYGVISEKLISGFEGRGQEQASQQPKEEQATQ